MVNPIGVASACEARLVGGPIRHTEHRSGRGAAGNEGLQVVVEACRKSVQPRIAESSVAYLAVDGAQLPAESVLSITRTGANWVAWRDSPPPKAIGDDFTIGVVAGQALPSLPSSDRRLRGLSCHLGSTELKSSDIV
jgi:hypothetical protein